MEVFSKTSAISATTTGIGSLPFQSISQAIDYAFDFDMPYLPQLPQYLASESMLTQSLQGLNLASDDLGKEFCCWDAALNRLDTEGIKYFKMQFCGCYCLKHYAPASFSHQVLAEALAKRLIAYIQFFKQRQIHLTIILDEPQITDKESFIQLYTDFYSHFPKSLYHNIGIHCCGTMPWETVLNFPFKAVSVDLSLQHDNLNRSIIRQLLLRNKVDLIFGAIPTDWESATRTQLEKLAKEIIFLATDPHRIIVSPACGHGLRSPQMADMGKKATQQLAKLLSTSNLSEQFAND